MHSEAGSRALPDADQPSESAALPCIFNTTRTTTHAWYDLPIRLSG